VKTLLEVKDLTVHYGKLAALKNVSMSVNEKDIITLIGANGAGKSTTLKAISGLLKPSSGEIWFDGERIDRMPPQIIVRRGIAHVPEGRRVFRDLSVLENFKMGAYLRKDSEIARDIDRICQYFPVLAERRKQQAGSLSGGEQQMLAIARALMSKPSLLMLDEPSLGLSPVMTSEIAKIITEINQRDKVEIILVEQNAWLALHLAQKGYLLETGNVVLGGRCQDLMRNEYVKKAYLGG
jgi:branched-chain amino acid transport system ATP-binding protein